MATYTLGPPQGVPGFKSATWKDERVTSPASLYAFAARQLESMERPDVSYTITAADLSGVRLAEHEVLSLGERVHVIDDTLGIDVWVRVVKIDRGLGEADDMMLSLDSKLRDAADYIADAVEAVSEIQATSTDDGPSAWQDDTTDDDGNPLIDGNKIARGTLPETFLAEIVADQTGGGDEQRYQIEILDPLDGSSLTAQQITDLGLSSAYIDNAMVPDDSSTPLSVGDRMPVKLPSGSQRLAGELPLLTPPPGEGVVAGAGANWQFLANSGAY